MTLSNESEIDTIGFAFPYPLAKLHFCKVVAYVHYPTIRYSIWSCICSYLCLAKPNFIHSTDMIKVVEDGTVSYNNSSAVARNPVLRNAKLL
jgi:hypothetical protein